MLCPSRLAVAAGLMMATLLMLGDWAQPASSRVPVLRGRPGAWPREQEAEDFGGLFARLRAGDGLRLVPSLRPAAPAPTSPARPAATARAWRAARPALVNETCVEGVVALTYASHRGRDERFCRSIESATRCAKISS
mmetsp:Transcript_22233/g.66743  ORF Transcript_22233/g.66743 Transcript_22233/m.66743 type:complete len:137 (-) Transcript_22233:1290-1700(-)